MRLNENDKLVMIGDSITDSERRRPRGDGPHGVGKGYVALVDSLLHAVYPELKVRVVNMGSGGNTVRDLAERWQSDVLDLRPDWLSIMIGINDVWRQFDQPFITESHVYLEEYEQTLRKLVTTTRPHVKGLVLMTPFYIEPNTQDAMRSKMDEYGAAVKRVAAETDSLLVDTQAVLAPILAHLYPAALAGDRVHPNLIGHMVLAKAFLGAVDFEWR
jgi:lysophospholipase L1-like esterase